MLCITGWIIRNPQAERESGREKLFFHHTSALGYSANKKHMVVKTTCVTIGRRANLPTSLIDVSVYYKSPNLQQYIFSIRPSGDIYSLPFHSFLIYIALQFPRKALLANRSHEATLPTLLETLLVLDNFYHAYFLKAIFFPAATDNKDTMVQGKVHK